MSTTPVFGPQQGYDFSKYASQGAPTQPSFKFSPEKIQGWLSNGQLTQEQIHTAALAADPTYRAGVGRLEAYQKSNGLPYGNDPGFISLALHTGYKVPLPSFNSDSNALLQAIHEQNKIQPIPDLPVDQQALNALTKTTDSSAPFSNSEMGQGALNNGFMGNVAAGLGYAGNALADVGNGIKSAVTDPGAALKGTGQSILGTAELIGRAQLKWTDLMFHRDTTGLLQKIVAAHPDEQGIVANILRTITHATPEQQMILDEAKRYGITPDGISITDPHDPNKQTLMKGVFEHPLLPSLIVGSGLDMANNALTPKDALGKPIGPGPIDRMTPSFLNENNMFKPPDPAVIQSQVRDLAGKITQGDPETVAKATEALPQVDTRGVKTAADLSNAIQSKIDALDTVKQEAFATAADKVPLENFDRTYTAGDISSTTNPVRNALNNLQELYAKTGDAENYVRIKNLASEAEANGLSAGEVDSIAREYGSQRSGFSPNTGEQLTSVNGKMFENTRQDLKQVSRDLMPDDTTKIIDQQQSKLIATKDAVDSFAEKVSNFKNKTPALNLVQKASSLVGKGINLVTFNGLKEFIKTIFPRSIGSETLNPLEIENSLSRNLATFQNLVTKLPSMSDTQAVGAINQFVTETHTGPTLSQTAIQSPSGTESPGASPTMGSTESPVASPSTVQNTSPNVNLTPEEQATGLMGGGGDNMPRYSEIVQKAQNGFEYIRNTEKSPDMGSRFAQDIEPSGKYMTMSETNVPPPQGWEKGNIQFDNPLVLDWKSAGHGGWKTTLSDMFNGLKGKELSQAVSDAGYDGIITMDGSNPQEIVSLKNFNPSTLAPSGNTLSSGMTGEPLSKIPNTKGFVYHATDPSRIDSILKNGLQPVDGKIFLAPSPDIAAAAVSAQTPNPVILKIPVKAISEAFSDPNMPKGVPTFYTTHPIPSISIH